MRLLVTVAVVVMRCLGADPIRRAIFDCDRIDVSFCCTTRVRSLCKEQCKDAHCVNPLLENTPPGHGEAVSGTGQTGNFGAGTMPSSNFELFTPPAPPPPVLGLESSQAVARDGQALVLRPSVDAVLALPSPRPPPPPPSQFSSTHLPITSVPAGGFPTLIPFEPSIDSAAFITKTLEEVTPESVIHSTVVKSMRHRSRTTPDPRIIKPPDSLVVIGDYDEESSLDNPGENKQALINAGESSETRARTLQSRRGILVPQSFISEEASVSSQPKRGDSDNWRQKRFCSLMLNPRRCKKLMDSFTRRPTGAIKRRFITTNIIMEPPHERSYRQRSARTSQGWSVKLTPVREVKTWPDGVETLPKFSVDGSAMTHEEASRTDVGSMIRTFSIGPSKVNMLVPDNVDFIEPKVIEYMRTTRAPVRIAINPARLPNSGSTTNSPPPSITSPSAPISKRPKFVSMQFKPGSPDLPSQCGVAPDFTPCVSSLKASHALLDCCRRQNLPPGCLPLCRYDITQAEVRTALDRGLCGIFNVAPFLECASQGRDNTECCRHKGIATKAGSQCEQFCRPAKGLTALGLQHIVCGNVIGDMLQCHHAGIRIR